MSKPVPLPNRLLISIGLGLLTVVVSWVIFIITAFILNYFIPLEVDESQLEIAVAVRTSIYLMWIFISIQVGFFSTLYFFDKKRN